MKLSTLVVPALVGILCLASIAGRAEAAGAAPYHQEHQARLHRHRTLSPAQRHARMVKYHHEHQARMHRHRAHLKARHTG